jgi:hypothetical protein
MVELQEAQTPVPEVVQAEILSVMEASSAA